MILRPPSTVMNFDGGAALRAMASAVRADGPVVVCTWGDLQAIPAMGAICDALQHVGGHEASALLRRAFSMGQPDELERVARDAGLPDAKVTLHDVTARFPGVGTLAQAYAGPLGLDDAGRTTDLEAAMEPRLAPFTRGGEVEFTLTGIIISGTGTAGA
jgi:hypothetical protein